jgi:hypothetical protein
MHNILEHKTLHIYSKNQPAKDVKTVNAYLHNFDINAIYVFRHCYACSIRFEIKDNESLCQHCEKERREKEHKTLIKDLINLHVNDSDDEE